MTGLGGIADFRGFQESVGDEYSEQDAEFVLEYLRNRGDPAAAKVACIRAGIRDRDRSLDSTAQRQLSRPVIQAAIKAAESVQAVGTPDITLGTLTAETERIRELAISDRQYPAALNAVKLTAQMHGFLDQNININHSVKVGEMNTADLMKIANGGRTLEGEFKELK
jgi:hypothetical protein